MPPCFLKNLPTPLFKIVQVLLPFFEAFEEAFKRANCLQNLALNLWTLFILHYRKVLEIKIDDWLLRKDIYKMLVNKLGLDFGPRRSRENDWDFGLHHKFRQLNVKLIQLISEDLVHVLKK